MYPARIDQVGRYGGKVVLSPSGKGELGYLQLMEQILRQDAKGKGHIGRDPDRLVAVSNVGKVPNLPYELLVREVFYSLIELDLPPRIDRFIFGVGAGNTISQTSNAIRRLQRQPLDVRVVEYAECPFVAKLLDGQQPPACGGWPLGEMGGTIYGVPVSKLNLDMTQIDGVLPLSSDERAEGRHIANQVLGLFSGFPTGMGPVGALRLARECSNQHIFMIVFDSVAKYEEHYDALVDIDFEQGTAIRRSDLDTPSDVPPTDAPPLAQGREVAEVEMAAL